MNDLIGGKVNLNGFRGVAFVGGFSYADVMDSAKGWAGSIYVLVFLCPCVLVFLCSCVLVFLCSCVLVFLCSCFNVLLGGVQVQFASIQSSSSNSSTFTNEMTPLGEYRPFRFDLT